MKKILAVLIANKFANKIYIIIYSTFISILFVQSAFAASAVAYDYSTAKYGTAHGYDSIAEAERVAKNYAGGNSVIVYSNSGKGYYSVSYSRPMLGDNSFAIGVGFHPSNQAEAGNLAYNTCVSKGGRHCSSNEVYWYDSK